MPEANEPSRRVVPLASSFRDPGGYLVNLDGRLLRIIKRPSLADVRASLASTTVRNLTLEDRLVPSSIVDPRESRAMLACGELRSLLGEDDIGMIVEHERMPFPAYPYEWPPEMLWEAGSLTLDLAERLLMEGLGIKDATPYNIMFRGPAPVFVDLLSLERRDPVDPIWLPYAQFVRTFLLPLLVNREFSIPLDQLFTTRSDGVEAGEVYQLCGPLRKLTCPFLSLVSVPTWLGAIPRRRGSSIFQKKRVVDPERARFILTSLFRTLRRTLYRLMPERGRVSTWSDYMTSADGSLKKEIGTKHDFVRAAMDEFRPKKVLDIGSNTGYLAVLAAEKGARVVTIDSDPTVVGISWRTVHEKGLDVLPLVVNLLRPSPSMGWRNQEFPGFLNRARGGFDAVLMLAIIHHLLVNGRIPLVQIFDLAAELTTDLFVVEFVPPNDPMFCQLMRGRNALFNGLTRELFEMTCRRHFEIVRLCRLPSSGRWLYLMRKK